MFEVTLKLINGESVIKTYDSLSEVKEELNTLTQAFFLENVVSFNITPVVKFDINLTLPKDKAAKLENLLQEII